MFIPRVVCRLNLICRASASGVVQSTGPFACGAVRGVSSPSQCDRVRNYTTSPAGIKQAHRWTSLEPELEEFLVPRKLSVSPLESWLSLRYSLPTLPEASLLPLEEGNVEGKSIQLPPSIDPVLEDSENVTPLSCKNVLEIRRRKMNRHKYKKLLKRTKFLRRRVMDGRRKKKQKRFERDLKRIWTRAGLKSAPEGWVTPKIFIKQNRSKSN